MESFAIQTFNSNNYHSNEKWQLIRCLSILIQTLDFQSNVHQFSVHLLSIIC